MLHFIASGKAGFSLSGGFAANGYGDHSPGQYSLQACIVAEYVLTFVFLMVIQGSTHRLAPLGFAGIPVGLCLTLIHLVGIPVTNLSVNPARSTGPAIFVGDWALSQLWMFWVVPIAGAAVAGVVYPMICGAEEPAKTAKGCRRLTLISPRGRYSGKSPPRSLVRFSNLVNSRRNTRLTLPVGPLRCFTRRSSAMPFKSSRSGL